MANYKTQEQETASQQVARWNAEHTQTVQDAANVQQNAENAANVQWDVEDTVPYDAQKNVDISNDGQFHMVDYGDSATQAQITQQTHERMVEQGNVVDIENNEDVASHYPDLRAIKKQERNAILKDKISALKNSLRSFLKSLKVNTYQFDVQGNILEARIYDTGIKEVTEKLTEAKANMLLQSDEIFKNAQYLYNTTDNRGDADVYRWNYFYTPVKIGDDIAGVRIAVRDMVESGLSQIYHWGIKNDQTLGVAKRGNKSNPGGTSSVWFDNSVPQNSENVNSQNVENFTAEAQENSSGAIQVGEPHEIAMADNLAQTQDAKTEFAKNPTSNQRKERQFFYNTLKNSEVFGGMFQDVFAEMTSENPEATHYDVISEMESMYNAAQRVQHDAYAELDFLMSENGHEWTGEDIDTAMGLIAKFRNDGNYEAANALSERIGEATTKMGQSIQALAKWSRTPTAR